MPKLPQPIRNSLPCMEHKVHHSVWRVCHFSLTLATSIQLIPPHPCPILASVQYYPPILNVVSFSTRTLHASLPPIYSPHAPLFSFSLNWRPYNIWLNNTNLEAPIMQFSPASCHFLPIFKIPQPTFFPSLWEMKMHTHTKQQAKLDFHIL